jgi:hypothetical protein
MQQRRKRLASSRPVDVMAVLQSEAEPVRQRRLPVNGNAMRQSRVALAEGATESAGQSRSQGSALVLQRKPFAWCRIPSIHQVAGVVRPSRWRASRGAAVTGLRPPRGSGVMATPWPRLGPDVWGKQAGFDRSGSRRVDMAVTGTERQ